MDRDIARDILRHVMDLRFQMESSDAVIDLVQDMIRYEPFASVAGDVDAVILIASRRVYTAWKQGTAIAAADIPAILHMIHEWRHTTHEYRVKDILESILTQEPAEALCILEALVHTEPDNGSAGFVHIWLHSRLSDKEFLNDTTRRFAFDDFLRLLRLLDLSNPSDTPPFTLQNVTHWMWYWYTAGEATVSRAEVDILFDTTCIDVLNLGAQCVSRHTPRVLLEACRARWPQASGADMDRLCQSLAHADQTSVPRVFWDVVASHTPLYIAYMAKETRVEKTKSLRTARRRWRAARFRVVVHAVGAGAVIWRLYETWALHPSRLACATSGLSTTVASSRQAMGACAQHDPLDPAFPTEFRLMDVAHYVWGPDA